MESMVERFLRYTKTNTRSDEAATSVPSTQTQVEFAKVLKADLEALGLSDVKINEKNGFVLGALPANTNDQYRPSALLLIWTLPITMRKILRRVLSKTMMGKIFC